MRATVVYPLALHSSEPSQPYIAQLVLPRDLTQAEADRLCAMIQTLVLQPDAYLAKAKR